MSYLKPVHAGWIRDLACLLLAGGLALSSSAEGLRSRLPGRLLIKSAAGSTKTQLDARLKSHGAKRLREIPSTGVQVIEVDDAQLEKVLADLGRDPAIAFAEPDYLTQAHWVPNDPLAISGAAWHLAKVSAGSAWDIATGTDSVVVAVLDSGVNAAHPDLAGRLLAGWDFVSNDSDPQDDFGHGTAVSGVVVGAGNNGLGGAGLAFGCRVLPVKVMDATGTASHSAVAAGIEYAVAQGARIINLSLGGDRNSATLQGAIDFAWSRGVLVVASAGNTGGTAPQYPGACNHVLAVGASTPQDLRARFSTYGGAVTLFAPGTGIWTTDADLNSPYTAWDGTSFSAPLVAGAAALALSAAADLTPTQLTEALRAGADDLGDPGVDAVFGHGRLNARRTLEVLLPEFRGTSAPVVVTISGVPADAVPPTVTITAGPVAAARLAGEIAIYGGAASDDLGLDRVEWSVNGGPWQPAEGSAQWSASVRLAAGRNEIRVRAVDASGNCSATVSRTVTRVVLAPVTVSANGAGRVTPDLGGRLLEIGRIYTAVAVPGPGWVFAGWPGASNESRVLRFTMQSNLVLNARFVPSPFAPVSGSYAGLAAEANGVLPQSAGAFRMQLGRMGTFSGMLRLGGARHGFSGRLALDGQATVSIPRRQQTPITVSLRVDLAAANNLATGKVSDGGWTAEIVSDRNVFNAKSNPAPQAGVREFALQTAGATNAAALAIGKISPSGVTSVRGRLSDGRPFTSSSHLSAAGQFPFHSAFDLGREVVIGWLDFPANNPAATGGEVAWVRTGTNAFATQLQAASVR
jgi:subtilisin family serine protease